MRRFPWRVIVLVASESALIMAAVALGTYLRLGAGATALLLSWPGLGKAAVIALVAQLCLYYADLYDGRVVGDRRELVVRSLQSLGATSLLLAGIYYWFPNLVIGRGVFALAAVAVVVVVITWRFVFEWASRRVRPRERLLLVGTGAASVQLARELHLRRHELGVEIVGFVDADPSRVGMPVVNPGVIGTIDDIPALVARAAVDRVVVSLADARGKLPMDKLLSMRLRGVTFDHLPSVYEQYTGKIALENLRPSWLVFSAGFRTGPTLRFAKRAMDVVTASIGLVLAIPVMLAVALVVKLESKGPALYHQRRVGLHGRLFTVHKFRSMRADAEQGTGAVWARQGDPRVTRVGRLLRRTRLDELPQLWNVLVGTMSLVGPRPERPEFVRELTEQIPFYGERHAVKPGLTGWAQVRYTYGASVEDAMEKLQYDLFYIKNLSVALDVFIIFETVKTVLFHKGS